MQETITVTCHNAAAAAAAEGEGSFNLGVAAEDPCSPAPQLGTPNADQAGIDRVRKVIGGLLVAFGTALSPAVPLDALLNAPIAALVASVVAKFYAPAFQPVFGLVLFLTNLAGLPLIRLGSRWAGRPEPKAYTARLFISDLGLACGYTAGLAILTRLGAFDAAALAFKWVAVYLGSAFGE